MAGNGGRYLGTLEQLQGGRCRTGLKITAHSVRKIETGLSIRRPWPDQAVGKDQLAGVAVRIGLDGLSFSIFGGVSVLEHLKGVRFASCTQWANSWPNGKRFRPRLSSAATLMTARSPAVTRRAAQPSKVSAEKNASNACPIANLCVKLSCRSEAKFHRSARFRFETCSDILNGALEIRGHCDGLG